MATIPNPVELRRRGMAALVRELGYVDAMRFLHQFGFGAGDYTKERQALLPRLTLEEWAAEGERLRQQRPSDAGQGTA